MNCQPVQAPLWNTLEVAKLVTSVLGPLTLLIVGLWIRRLTERLERRGRLSQIEIEWRINVFRELAPFLNDLFCYFTYVGKWRDMTPHDVITAKRECDRIVNTNRFLWSDGFISIYREFTASAFVEGSGRGTSLVLRANVEMHSANEIWRDSWVSLFSPPNERIRRADFTRLHNNLITQAVRDLQIFRPERDSVQ